MKKYRKTNNTKILSIDQLPFPILPILEVLKSKISPRTSAFESVGLLGVQHLMQTTGSLIQTLVANGLLPTNIFMTGKIYSMHHGTVHLLEDSLKVHIIRPTEPRKLGTYRETLEQDVARLWGLATRTFSGLRLIIVLDDGGTALKNVPPSLQSKVIGIEQTISGIRLRNSFGDFPVINVAGSAAKKIIEPDIVSESVKLKLGDKIEAINPSRIGIVGYGHIGKAVARDFSHSYTVFVFDKNKRKVRNAPRSVTVAPDLHTILKECDLIIGTTGTDISSKRWLDDLNSDKTLLSLSSGDVEFNKLLKAIDPSLKPRPESLLGDIEFKTRGGHILRILRGGMVANFTGQANSSPPMVIQFTRGLLLGAIYQAIKQENEIRNHSCAIMLDASVQRFVTQNWFSLLPERVHRYPRKVVEGFKDLEWIKERSKGIEPKGAYLIQE